MDIFQKLKPKLSKQAQSALKVLDNNKPLLKERFFNTALNLSAFILSKAIRIKKTTLPVKEELENKPLFLDLRTSLPTGVVFTRQSEATHIDPQGRLTFGGGNLQIYSEKFDHPSWIKNGVEISLETIKTPQGPRRCAKIIEDETVGPHYIYGANINLVNATLLASLYVKACERTSLIVEISNFETGSIGCRFDLKNGVCAEPTSTTLDYVPLQASMLDVGNGWFRCCISAEKRQINQNNFMTISLDNGETNHYAGKEKAGAYIWGAQVEASTFARDIGDYLPTSETPTFTARFDHDPGTLAAKGLMFEGEKTNLLPYSEKFDDDDDENTQSWRGYQIEYLGYDNPSPSNVKNALRILAKADGAYLELSAPVEGVALRTFSIWLRSVDSVSEINYRPWRQADWQGQKITSQWRRYVFQPITAAYQPALMLKNKNDKIEIWGAQLEDGDIATSYIPTYGAPKKRLAESFILIGHAGAKIELYYAHLINSEKALYPYVAGKPLDLINIYLRGAKISKTIK